MTFTNMRYCCAALISLLSLATIGSAHADNGPIITRTAFTPGLTVNGHADLKVKPDIAHVTVGVTTQSNVETTASQQNAAITTKVIAALRESGVAVKDIETDNIDIEPQYNYQVSPAVLTGYQATNSVDVTIRNLADAGPVIDKVTQAGATNVSGISFDLADRTAAEQEALAMAVTEAKAKAAAMAQAAGVTRGPLLSLSEGAPTTVQPMFITHTLMAAREAAPTTPVEGNVITISADVTAVYEIEQ